MDNSNYPPDRATTSSRENHVNKPAEGSFVTQLKKPVIFVSILLLLLCLGIYLYKNSQLADARRQAEQEQAAVIKRANARVAENDRYFLQVLVKPFSWALRTALLSGNVEQVDQYLYQFVQERNFSLLLVADVNGTIISSTNQVYSNTPFGQNFDPAYLTADSTIVNDSDRANVVVATPIMGFNSKLGTFLAVYNPEAPLSRENSEDAK